MKLCFVVTKLPSDYFKILLVLLSGRDFMGKTAQIVMSGSPGLSQKLNRPLTKILEKGADINVIEISGSSS